MKLKHFILVVMVVAIVGIGIWWLMQPTAAPEKTAEAPKAAKTETPKAAALGKIAAPLAPLVQTTTTTVVTPVKAAEPEVASADPQASWKTALPDIARMLRDNDVMALVRTYMPPDHLTPETLQGAQKMNDTIQQEIAGYRMATNEPPAMVELFTHPLDGEAAILERMAEETPTLNDAGDEATFAVPEDKAKEMKPLTMIKVAGRWYLKEIVISQGIRP